MFGGMVFALPVFIWRVHETEVKPEETIVIEGRTDSDNKVPDDTEKTV